MPPAFTDFGLDSPLLRAVSDLGFEAPTPIQERVIPVVLEGRDVVGRSQTGTGKTAAFGLPILQALGAEGSVQIRALVFAPTRELALQVHTHLEALARHTGLRGIVVCGGGEDFAQQEHALRLGADWVVATPGRFLDHLRRRYLNLAGLRFLVLDEADRLLEYGFMEAVREIASYLPERRQTLLFSATLPPQMQELARRLLDSPVRIDVGATTPVEALREELWPVPARQKFALLTALLKQGLVPEGTLVFARTRHKATSLARRLEAAGRTVGLLHGELPMAERRAALEAFRKRDTPYLVATDLAARGLDISGVRMVLNYDAPVAPEDYIHRTGRTARAGQSGDALTFMSRPELALVAKVEYFIGRRLPERRLEGFHYEEERDDPAAAIHARHRQPADLSERPVSKARRVSPFTRSGGARRGFEADPEAARRKKKIRRLKNRRLPHQR